MLFMKPLNRITSYNVCYTKLLRIEEIVTEQQSLFDYPQKIRILADQYAKRVIQKHSVVIVPEKKRSPDYATVDLNSINTEAPRTAGAEHVVYETIKSYNFV